MLLSQILALWSFFGAFIFVITILLYVDKMPEKRILIFILISGPAVWVILLLGSFLFYLLGIEDKDN